MGRLTVMDRVRAWVSSVGWWLFLWGNGHTAESYWDAIYEQERTVRGEA